MGSPRRLYVRECVCGRFELRRVSDDRLIHTEATREEAETSAALVHEVLRQN